MTNATEDAVAGKVAANIEAAAPAVTPLPEPSAPLPDPASPGADTTKPTETAVADRVAANIDAIGAEVPDAEPVHGAATKDRDEAPISVGRQTTEAIVAERVTANADAATPSAPRIDTEAKVADKVAANIDAASGAGGAAQTKTQTPLLEMRGVSKTFPGVKALNNVSLKAWGGEVLSLMGENGAGKSTLMKVLSGAYRADAGSEIYIDGTKVEMTDPRVAKAHGIAIIYQELSLAPNLTVAENIYLGNEPKKGRFVDRAAMAVGCKPVLERLGAPFGPKTIVSTLSIAEQQLVEIARALHANARLIVLDEPTTPLSTRETDRLFDLIRQLRAEGVALIYISHRMAEVYELSDRVSVLRDGGYVGTLEKGEINADALVKMMVGRDLSTFYQKKADPDARFGAAMLEVRDVTDGGKRVKPCSLTVHKGEVLGIAGLVGAGRTELARLIYGADPRKGGTIALDGHALDPRTPLDGLSAGIAYLTEDRKQLGLFLDMSCGENINIGVIERDANRGFLNLRRAAERATAAFDAMRVRAASPIVQVGSLSGGNQQKVLLSRWLEIGPKVLILDEPTRGVDIGAKAEIYRIIDDLAKRGIAVIVISSEMAEIIGTCDRVVVMREGQIEGEVGGRTGRAITQENIMSYAAGVAA